MKTGYLHQGMTGRKLVAMLVVAASYLGIALLILKLTAVLPSTAAPIWPSAGIALFAALCYGNVGILGVLIGAFLLYVISSPAGAEPANNIYLFALLKAAGNATQAWFGAWLVRKCVGFPNILANEITIVKFLLFAAPVGCLVSATWNIGLVHQYAQINTGEIYSNWLTWWVGDSIGVLIVTPLLLVYFFGDEQIWRYRRLSFTLPLLIIFLIFLFIKAQNASDLIEKQKLRFYQMVSDVGVVIDQRLQAQLDYLSSIQVFFMSSTHVSRADFHAFTRPILQRFPDILALEWIEHVEHIEREAFVERVSSEGYPGFEIRNQFNDRLSVAEPADEYLVINYINPYQGNAIAHGYNILSKPEARDAVLKARESGQLIAAGPIRLIQETEEQLGFVIYLPVYAYEPERKVTADRDRRFKGVIASVSRINELLNVPKTLSESENLFFEIYETNNGIRQDLIYQMRTSQNVMRDSPLQLSRKVQFANHDWVVDFYPTSPFVEANMDGETPILLVADLLVALTLVGWLLSITGRHYRTEQIVTVRTEDLKREIAERSRAEEMLSYHATHDMLTELVNRREFEKRLQHLCSADRPKSESNVLCFMDLDRFKLVNDTCGHIAGDELLRQLAILLQEHIRSTDTLARFGGDEFALILENCSLDKAMQISEAILRDVGDYKFQWNGKSFHIGISIGMVMIDNSAQDINEVIKEADEACYTAKLQGRNRICLYREDDNSIKQRGEVEWVTRINDAIEQNRFILMAQEIRDVNGGSVMYELLLRMIDEDGKYISPGSFLPVAERYNLIEKIDHWVIDYTLQYIASHFTASDCPIFCINLSADSIARPEFLQYLTDSLYRYRSPCHKICFELTETSAIQNLVDANSFISAIKELGCAFALDDFGSGFSSFAYLKNLPVDYLKIDGIFVKDVLDDEIDMAMVKSINDIGRVMGKKTIAEYVESDAIMQEMKRIGVDYVQGYGVAIPVELDKLFQSGSIKSRS